MGLPDAGPLPGARLVLRSPNPIFFLYGSTKKSGTLADAANEPILANYCTRIELIVLL